MTGNLQTFLDDIHIHLLDNNVIHAEVFDSPNLNGFHDIAKDYDNTIVIGYNSAVDDVEPSLYENFVNSLTTKQKAQFRMVLDQYREVTSDVE